MASQGKSLHKQDVFLAALMGHPTVKLAAKASGISEATATRWLADPAFDGRYREARRQALQEALALLQQSLFAAILTLQSLMQDTNARPSTRVQAAGKLLEIGFKAIEFDKIDQRLEALAQGLEDMKRAIPPPA